MNRGFRVFVCALAALVLIAGCGQTGTEAHRGFVKKIEKGSATILRADAKEAIPVAANTLLFAGDTIKTAAETEIILQFSTGAVSRLLSDTEFKVEGKKAETTDTKLVLTRLVKGICYFYVPKGETGAKKFEVATERAIASIKGTTGKVEEDGQKTTLTVGEGTVAFAKKGGESIDVTAFQTASVDDSGLKGPDKVNTLLDPFLAEGKIQIFETQGH